MDRKDTSALIGVHAVVSRPVAGREQLLVLQLAVAALVVAPGPAYNCTIYVNIYMHMISHRQ